MHAVVPVVDAYLPGMHGLLTPNEHPNPFSQAAMIAVSLFRFVL
jgi:hypothetical protein